MSTSAAQLNARIAALRARLDGVCDALLVTHLPNIFYVTGLRATAGAVIVTASRILLIIDGRYLAAASQMCEVGEAPDGLELVEVPRSYEEAIRDELAALAPATIGVEASHVSVQRWNWLSQRLAGSGSSLIPTDGVIEQLRAVKDADEIACLRVAGARLTEAVSLILTVVRIGQTEIEFAAEIGRILAAVGFEDRAFPAIVASGPNSALPHAHPSGRMIADGELLLLDFGGVYDGYCVDLTRTVAQGDVGEDARRLHAAVAEAQQAAIAAVAPGVLGSVVDDAARVVLERHGLAQAFGHSTGHGLGIEVHEAPRIARRGSSGADVPLQPGMVITVEPGAYLPGFGGVRIEDDLLVTSAGYELLTTAPRDLLPRSRR